jgi:hypothetical protein
VIGFDHIVLLFTEESVLRRKKARQLAWKGLTEQIEAMRKPTVGRGLVGEEAKPFAGKGINRRSAELFYSNSYHGILDNG